jgi:pyruvate formate lyase activating enzyme
MSAGFSKKLKPRPAADGTAALRVGGLVPLSTTDYPGYLAAVVFCQGCPWRCAYCHNPHLLPREGEHEIEWAEVLAFLERRRGLLDAVVFSGGEPTLQTGLPAAIRAVKNMGFAVAVHTAGIYPHRLRDVLPLVDWVGMDIKAPFDDYAGTTGVAGSGARALASMQMIIASGVAHEFRTTVHPALLPGQKLNDLAPMLAGLGVRHYALQEYRDRGCATPVLGGSTPLTDSLCRAFAAIFPAFSVRRA